MTILKRYSTPEKTIIEWERILNKALSNATSSNGDCNCTKEKLTDLNFYSNGFTATYSTETVGYRWVKDANGRIVQLTNIYGGENILVTWEDSEI